MDLQHGDPKMARLGYKTFPMSHHSTKSGNSFPSYAPESRMNERTETRTLSNFIVIICENPPLHSGLLRKPTFYCGFNYNQAF